MEMHTSWLPPTAVEDGALRTPVREVVEAWSAKWFASRQASSSGRPARVPPDARTHAVGWRLADGLRLALADGADQAIVDLLVGQADGAEAPTAADLSILHAIAEACLTDLRSRLSAAFRLAEDAPWRAAPLDEGQGPAWVWTVGVDEPHSFDERPSLLEVVADEALIVRGVRAALPLPPRPDALRPLAAALARHPVDVSAFVGRCRLTTSELAGLGPGDVVVLDRPLGQKVQLAVAGEPKPLACTVQEADGALALTLTAN